uniref:Uncharacterized protein n=1 Tax=Anopheles dirus TaxID=7168 RepID=A0A182NCC4_9DIPT
MVILGNMSRSLVNLMLPILRKKFNAPHLPKDANVIPEVDTFSLQVSIDGLPLFKSSAVQLLPILIKVEKLSHASVMLVGV